MKMNKIFPVVLILAGSFFASCTNEEDDLFDQSAAQRLNEASTKYTQLIASGNGKWAMEYYPTASSNKYTGRGYLMACEFKSDLSVNIGMNNLFSGNAYREASSNWQVIADDGPVLSFNTYNANLHQFSTPEDLPYTSDNEQGTGVGGDYEFVITDSPEDHSFIMLKGKKRGTYNRLTPIPDTTTLEAYVTDVQNFRDRIFVDGASNPQFMMLGADSMQLDSAFTGIMRIFPIGTDAITTQTLHPFLFTKRDGNYYLRFRDAISYGDGKTVQEFRYDASDDRFVSDDDASTYIAGFDPVVFFFREYDAGRSFRFQRSSSMSDGLAALYDAVVEKFNTFRYTVTDFQILKSSDTDAVIRLRYRDSRKRTVTVNYNYTLSRSAKGMTLTYVGGATTPADNLLNTVPELKTFLDAFSGETLISAGTTAFNLSSFRLTSASDANIWVVADLN